MNIILLEDNGPFAKCLIEDLKHHIQGRGRIYVEHVATELEFRKKIGDLASRAFDLAIFDVMVAWCRPEDLFAPTREVDAPSEILAELTGMEKRRGGIRCRDLLNAEIERIGRRQIPEILYTILDEKDLRAELGNGSTHLVIKQGAITHLIEKIYELTKID